MHRAGPGWAVRSMPRVPAVREAVQAGDEGELNIPVSYRHCPMLKPTTLVQYLASSNTSLLSITKCFLTSSSEASTATSGTYHVKNKWALINVGCKKIIQLRRKKKKGKDTSSILFEPVITFILEKPANSLAFKACFPQESSIGFFHIGKIWYP